MKATGIVRRIDDLGRVVIPKEIRRTLRIREGDPLEIYTDKEGEIILKKYSPMSELADFAREYAESLQNTTGHVIGITDRDTILAITGYPKKEMQEKRIHQKLEALMQDRITYEAGEDKEDKIICLTSDESTEGKFYAQTIVPIICDGDCIGSVIIMSKEANVKLSEIELKLAQTAAIFLGKQMEP